MKHSGIAKTALILKTQVELKHTPWVCSGFIHVTVLSAEEFSFQGQKYVSETSHYLRASDSYSRGFSASLEECSLILGIKMCAGDFGSAHKSRLGLSLGPWWSGLPLPPDS